MLTALQQLFDLLPQAMLADQYPLRRRLDALQRAGHANPGLLDAISRDLHTSMGHCATRQASLPRPEFPQNLPVVDRRADIAEAIANHQVVVLCGETGSGKTTQLPKICLELGRGVAGLIGHTQPRRIAARSVAQRIADELKTPLGQLVGYKVRFTDQVSDSTVIKLMTDGILLAETQADRLLTHYDTLIIDEAHERSLNIDFLLGYLKTLLPKRSDLKLIITSATIDPERFSRHFDNAPMLMVSGRTYPVEIRYRPLTEQTPPSPGIAIPGLTAESSAKSPAIVDEDEPTMLDAISHAVDECLAAGPGDILIFLSGEREIRETADELQKHHRSRAEILPLYARLSTEEQQKIFAPHPKRRIVLSTNVAETSLTVPGIRFVIDPGLARIARYSPRTKVQRLPIEPISQASANQRSGRCGRVSAGICIRLYSEEDFTARPLYTEPEILRSNLAAVILQMKSLKLGDVDRFPFIDPPEARLIRDGYATLHEIGAVDNEDNLTPLGEKLAKLPVDPRIGKMILSARAEGVVDEVLIIAAALSVQDPRLRPLDQQENADRAHAKFVDPHSDFITFLNLWKWYQENDQHLSQSKLRRLCEEHFLSLTRLREWRDIHFQLRGLLTEINTAATATTTHPFARRPGTIKRPRLSPPPR